MPRSRDRICLQDGLKLDLNRLQRQGFVTPGSRAGPRFIQWTHSYWGVVARDCITVDMQDDCEGSFRIRLGDSLDQTIRLRAQPRHFGGRQWYFVCPRMGTCAAVLWKPPGAPEFCSRQTWRRQVAYASQFDSPVDRAWRGKAKIKNRLIADLDADEWDLPPKPKWMRWGTYNRYEARCDRYDEILDRGTLRLVARLLARG